MIRISRITFCLPFTRGGATHHADEAVSLLCDEPWRFQCGFSDNSTWCATELIRAVIQYCRAENYKKLEKVILCYASPNERTSAGYRHTGLSRFNLLSAIPAAHRSTRAERHYGELKRKFGRPEDEPRGVTGGWVESPIKKKRCRKDDRWIIGSTQLKNTTRSSQENSSPDSLMGGARELAQVLETQVQEDPNRFARLSLRFPPDANPVYLERDTFRLERLLMLPAI